MNRLRTLFAWRLVLLIVACIAVIAPSPKSTSLAQTHTPTPRVTVTPTRREATPRAVLATSTPTATSASSAITGTLTTYFLDVGQGDSILLAGPDFTILIDAGEHDRKDVVPYLDQIGVESIDLFVGTHPHADHIGQFPEVLEAFPVSEVWLSGDTNTTRTFEDTIDAIAASGAAYHEPRAGEMYQIGSARIEVLNPAHPTGEANEGSVSFRLIFGDVAFMFTGDAEAPSEREMIDSGRDLRVQILKLGHHGSDTSSTLAFLLAVEPELAIWSAGTDNSYGHPHQQTLDRLEGLGVRVLGTALEGTIVVSTDGTSYAVEEYVTPTPTPTRTRTPTRTPASRRAATQTPTPGVAPTGCATGQVNINTASFEELQQITQIGPGRAAAVLELRPFSSIDDMERISGVGAGTVEQIKEQGLACVE